MKRLIAAMLAACALLGGCASANTQTDSAAVQQNGYRQVSQDEAAALMKSETDCIILDVRTEEEFAAGHIPNAICVPNEAIGSGDIAQLPDKKQLILVYCRSGRRSKEAAKKLAENGYSNIVEFGGIIDWQGDIVTQ